MCPNPSLELNAMVHTRLLHLAISEAWVLDALRANTSSKKSLSLSDTPLTPANALIDPLVCRIGDRFCAVREDCW